MKLCYNNQMYEIETVSVNHSSSMVTIEVETHSSNLINNWSSNITLKLTPVTIIFDDSYITLVDSFITRLKYTINKGAVFQIQSQSFTRRDDVIGYIRKYKLGKL
jgi:hypothetical protein